MTKRLYSLRDVPEDEIQEIREMLQRHEIDFYETDPGNWGISSGAFWLRNDDQFEKAGQLLSEYHLQRTQIVKQEHELLVKQGKSNTLLRNIIKNPIKFIFYFSLILFILYISTKPFLFFGN